VVISALPQRTVNATLETAEPIDLHPNAAVHGVNATKGVHITANGEEPKTIIITIITVLLHRAPAIITITMGHHLTITITTIITVEVPRAEVLRAEAPRAEVPRAEVPRAGRVKKIIIAEKTDQTVKTMTCQTDWKWFLMALWDFYCAPWDFSSSLPSTH